MKFFYNLQCYKKVKTHASRCAWGGVKLTLRCRGSVCSLRLKTHGVEQFRGVRLRGKCEVVGAFSGPISKKFRSFGRVF